jgi:hypothetical protein
MERKMSLELANAADASRGLPSADYIPSFRKLREISLPKLNEEQRDVQARVDAFIRWRDDVRPAFDAEAKGGDKFSELISIARKHAICLDFLTSEVGVNGSTIWRWAKDKVRPSPYIGRQLVRDIEQYLIRSLVVAAFESKLLSVDGVVMGNTDTLSRPSLV